MLSNLPGDATILRSEPSDHPANGLDETGVQNDRILVAHPTAGAVKMILEHFGYDVSQTDWQKIISSHDIATGSDRQQSANNPVGDYAHGLRGTFVGTRRI
jgi:hypothetical protein